MLGFPFSSLKLVKMLVKLGFDQIWIKHEKLRKIKKWKTSGYVLTLSHTSTSNLFGCFRDGGKKTCVEIGVFTLPLDLMGEHKWFSNFEGETFKKITKASFYGD